MPTETQQPPAPQPIADRIGFARLTKRAFDGENLFPLWQELMTRVDQDAASAGEQLDLALITQLFGHKQAGLSVQTETLAQHQLFRSPCASQHPQMRVLALAADIDMGGNTPIEFLLETSGIELLTLYVVDGVPLPDPLPAHDLAIVIASDSEECRGALAKIAARAPTWPAPLLNPPHLIGHLDRDKLYRLIGDVDGLDIPATIPVGRDALAAVAAGDAALADVTQGVGYPIIARPRGSHAGFGLARIEDQAALAAYLEGRIEDEYFVARYVDYASDDGMFRKYRIVVVDGKPYACHMAIADRWDIWYLNAGMAHSASKRLEEAAFFHTFDFGFARRHRTALDGMIERIGLDYFTIDCAQTPAGDLLVFEIDNTAVVHNMDSPELYPYKPPQMIKIFEAFAAMLEHRVASRRQSVA
ncbi:ATP-grasp domain-containing protein [Rhodopseudomonas sp. NSM]|uniref:ATP-grasp domain-containing protein n=1 Tax=Rhodopseudomonas sp. NSM TaxID=3457630 RepID=UPI004035D3B1